MGNVTDWFHTRLNSSSHWTWYVHGAIAGQWNKTWEFQWLCLEASCKQIWLETSWAHAESVSGQKLQEIEFVQALIDKCVLYCDDIISIIYLNSILFFGNRDITLMHIIKHMKDKRLNIEDQGHPGDYVEVIIKKLLDGAYEFTQHAVIDPWLMTLTKNSYILNLSQQRYHFNHMHLKFIKGWSQFQWQLNHR